MFLRSTRTAIIFVLIPNSNERETRHQSLYFLATPKATIQAPTTHQQQKESQNVCVFLFICLSGVPRQGWERTKEQAHCPGAKRVAAGGGDKKHNFVCTQYPA